MRKLKVGEVPGNVLGMLGDLMSKLQKGGITPRELGRFLKRENPFVEGDYSEFIAEWEEFYKKYFAIELDLSGVAIPPKPKGKYRLLIITSIGLEALYAKCKELFPCWRWTEDNLDKIVVENERDAKTGAYATWVKDVVEADEDLRNMSANDIKERGLKTETLAERLIHELKFFGETGKHLDVNNVTLCSGSRYSGGDVPFVDWRGGRMRVGGYHVVDAYGHLRARQQFHS